MRKILFIAFCFCFMVACNNEHQPQQNQFEKESKIAFYAVDSASHVRIEMNPDSITNILARCVNMGESNNPFVVVDEENSKYSVSFFPMEDSISQVSFFFSSNLDGTDVTMTGCLVTKDNEEFACADIEELLHCTSFIIYPELDGPLMRNFVSENEHGV